MDSLPGEFNSGVYYGWATVDDGPIHKMVMSVGWNPHFKNTKRSMVGTARRCPITDLKYIESHVCDQRHSAYGS